METTYTIEFMRLAEPTITPIKQPSAFHVAYYCTATLSSAAFVYPRRRCVLAAAEVGGFVMLIDAKNERAAKWYASYGAMPLLDQPLSLVLPLATVEESLKAAGKLPS